MNTPDDIVIVEGARTPIGSFMGSLSGSTATDMATVAGSEALKRAKVSPEWVDEVIIGNVLQSSKDAAYLARHTALNLEIPLERPALIVNRACGSGIEAIIQGAKSLALEESQFILAGGSENMSLCPYAIRNARQGMRMGHDEVDDTLMSSLFDKMAGCMIGQTVETLAEKYSITREQADAWSFEAKQKAIAAQSDGIYQKEIVPVKIRKKRQEIDFDKDESIYPIELEKLAKLKPVFHPQGQVTAGNSSGLNDAACMLVMCRRSTADKHGLKPIGALAGWANVGVDPKLMGLGAVPAAELALKRAGETIYNIDVVELNDSFAVQALVCAQELGVSKDKININGGALALGHPMGATGSRLILSALYELQRSGKSTALATLCIGGGQGSAVVLKRV